jgi:hypothetical protein
MHTRHQIFHNGVAGASTRSHKKVGTVELPCAVRTGFQIWKVCLICCININLKFILR